MFTPFLPYIKNLDHQQKEMISTLETWANINSGSENIIGLERMFSVLESTFSILGGTMTKIPLAPRQVVNSEGKLESIQVGNALHIVKRPAAKFRFFLAGHMDTVFSKDSPFQKARIIDGNKMQGPGVADMKGGLLIMLKALETFEGSPWASEAGWELLINPDEEVGSSSSEYLFIQGALRNHIGLIFEPSFPDGAFVNSRKGTVNITVVVKGKAAHAGRDFHSGSNAIAALARFIVKTDALNNPNSNMTINVGKIEGGKAVNIVPDLAICKINIRADTIELIEECKMQLQNIAKECEKDGIEIAFFEQSQRVPKSFDKKTKALFEVVHECGKALSLDVAWRPSGGVCDGNILSAAGLPTIDTLGAIGGNLHTTEEYIDLQSLSQRASLTALLMMICSSETHFIKEIVS